MINLKSHMYEGLREFAFMDQQINSDMTERFRKYLDLFESGLYLDGLERLNDNHNIQLSLIEFTLLSKLRDIQSNFKNGSNESRDYPVLVSDFLENDEVFINTINANNIIKYDYFFIQAFFRHIKDVLLSYGGIDDNNYIAKAQLEHIAQISISLAENYSNLGTSYRYIELTKDRQYYEIEKLTEGANDFIYDLGELSNLTSKSKYIEALLTKLKSQYLVMSAAEDDFNNIFEYLGYLQYIGNDHFLYEMGMNELENEIINQLRALTLPDIVFLLEDDIYTFVDDSDLEFQGWDHLKKCIYSSDEFYKLVSDIKRDFLDIVPEYFPE